MTAESATDFFTETAKQTTDQMLQAIRQTATFSLETSSAWFEAVAKVMPAVPALPFLPSEETLKQLTEVGFDTAQNLISLQREIAGEVLAKMASLSA